MQNNTYILTYSTIDSAGHEYEEEQPTLKAAMQRAAYIVQNYDITSHVSISDNNGEMCEVS